MTRHYYPEITLSAFRLGVCPICGKTRKRSKTFTHTVNPLNRHADGTVKTREEVRADVVAIAAAWRPDFTCKEH